MAVKRVAQFAHTLPPRCLMNEEKVACFFALQIFCLAFTILHNTRLCLLFIMHKTLVARVLVVTCRASRYHFIQFSSFPLFISLLYPRYTQTLAKSLIGNIITMLYLNLRCNFIIRLPRPLRQTFAVIIGQLAVYCVTLMNINVY